MIKRERKFEESAFERFLNAAWKELKIDFKNMFNWLLFYKPQNKLDKILHIFEVIIVWIVIQFSLKGFWGI